MTQKNLSTSNYTINPNLNNLQLSVTPSVSTNIATDENDNSRFLASLLGQGAGMLGSAIQGGDVTRVGQVFDYNRQFADRINEQKKQIELVTNPQSDVSKKKRLVYEQTLGFKIPDNISASDLEDRNVLQGLYAQSQPKPVLGRGGGVAQPKEAKPKEEKESKTQNETNIFTSQADRLKSQLLEYKKLVKNIPYIGGASEIADAKALQRDILLTIKDIKKTGSLDAGSIQVIEDMIGTPEFTRDPVIDARINRSLINLNKDVEAQLRGTGTINTNYTPYVPFEQPTEQEKEIINNYFSNPNDTNYKNLYNKLMLKKGF